MIYFADDKPEWTDERKVLIREQLHIPALHMIGYARMKKANGIMEDHYHRMMEFTAVLNGTQQYIVNDKKYELYGNDFFVTYPYEQHGNGTQLQKVSELLWFQIDLSSPDNFLGLASPFDEQLYQQVVNYHQRKNVLSVKEIQRLLEVFWLLADGSPSKRLLGYSHFLDFVVQNIKTEDSGEKDGYSEEVQRAMDYIHRHLLKNLRLEKIAKECEVSLSHFKCKFKEEVGVTPHEYILIEKIQYGKMYLQRTQKPIIELAYELGFSSSQHFSSVFKKYTGHTPTEYRQKIFWAMKQSEHKDV